MAWNGRCGVLRVPFSFVEHLLVLVMQQLLESRSFPGMVVQASLRWYPGPVAYARGHCDRRKALEYGHGVISSVRSNVCLSSLVQAIASSIWCFGSSLFCLMLVVFFPVSNSLLISLPFVAR